MPVRFIIAESVVVAGSTQQTASAGIEHLAPSVDTVLVYIRQQLINFTEGFQPCARRSRLPFEMWLLGASQQHMQQRRPALSGPSRPTHLVCLDVCCFTMFGRAFSQEFSRARAFGGARACSCSVS
jgi:hypothetical protein